MKVGDLVMIIPDNCDGFVLVAVGQVGMIVKRDDRFEAKGITGNLVNLVEVQFGEVSAWFDTDQVEVI